MPQATDAVSFPTWKAAQRGEGFPVGTRAEHEREILGFLHRCKVKRAPATIMLAKEYLVERARQGPTGARVPLLWFFQATSKAAGATGKPAEGKLEMRKTEASGRTGDGDRRGAGQGGAGPRPPAPPLAAMDLGGADWERDLIKAARAAGFLWLTEET